VPHLPKLIVFALAVLAVNLPFGFWRSGARKFSLPWFLAIHGPVPFVIGFRLAAGVGWQLSTVPLLAGAYFLGQLCGGRMGRRWRDSNPRTA
jgi:hypothetical protein